jgi:prepilin-type N-terminal cleavage/methylation domain-containing protein
MKHRPAFTLIEVLVVVAIMALLAAILMPALKEARRVSKRTVCLANLDQIAKAMRSYLHNNRDTFPTDVARLPSAEPDKRALPDMLMREFGTSGSRTRGTYENKIFLCPEDRITKTDVALDPIIQQKGPRYYDSQRTSYEWNDLLNGRKLHHRPTIEIYDGLAVSRVPVKDLLLVSDYEIWHGDKNQPRTFNAMYLNMESRSDKQ